MDKIEKNQLFEKNLYTYANKVCREKMRIQKIIYTNFSI